MRTYIRLQSTPKLSPTKPFCFPPYKTFFDHSSTISCEHICRLMMVLLQKQLSPVYYTVEFCEVIDSFNSTKSLRKLLNEYWFDSHVNTYTKVFAYKYRYNNFVLQPRGKKFRWSSFLNLFRTLVFALFY